MTVSSPPCRRKAAKLALSALVAVALGACSSTGGVAKPTQVALVYRAANGHVWLLASKRRARPRRLGVATQALLAPNGALVAAIGGKPATLTIYHSAKRLSHRGELRFAAPDWSGGGIQLLAWSPDSRYVALVANALSSDGEQPELIVVDVATGVISTIASGDFLGASFAPTRPDRLVYARATIDQLDDNRVLLYTTSARGLDTRQITHAGLAADPVWGARGIAFDRLAQLGSETRSPLYQLWLIQPGGRDARQLTQINAGPPALDSAGAAVSVSAKGTRLVANFSAPDLGSTTVEVWAIDIARVRPVVRRVRFGGARYIAQGLSRSGTSILLDGLDGAGQQDGVATVSWVGGPRSLIAAGGDDASWNR